MLKYEECHGEDPTQLLALHSHSPSLHLRQIENHSPSHDQDGLYSNVGVQARRLARHYHYLHLVGRFQAIDNEEVEKSKDDVWHGLSDVEKLTDSRYLFLSVTFC